MNSAQRWRKSSRSGSAGECVEVAFVPGTAAVRDTKNRTAGTLTFPELAWRELVRTI